MILARRPRSAPPRRPRLVVLLLLAALGGCDQGSRPGEAELPPARGAGAPAPPTLPKVAADTAKVAVAAGETIGTTFPRARAEVGPPLSGLIASIDVQEGDRVAKGQVLFRLRTSDLALHAQQAGAAVAAARVALAAAETEFARAQRLFEHKAIEQAQFDRARAQLEAARAGVDQAKVGVALARQVMNDAVVRSPLDGVVTHKLKNAGEMATMMPPTVVLVVEDHSQLELRFRLPEQRLAAIQVGQAVTATFGATGQTRQATVIRIAPAVDPTTRTVEVVARIDNADGAIKSGMLATVEAPAPAAAAGTPVVPEAARPAPEAGGPR